MNSINFLLLFLLIFALVLSLFKTGKNARIARAFRILITFLGILFFGYWFFQKSLNNFLEKSMSLQVINRLNQPIDFYAIKVINKDNNQFLSKHLGKIRTNHYQIEYFDMSNSNEYWVIGYLPKSKMVYFTPTQCAKQRSGPKNRGQKLPQSKCETLRKSTRSYRISKTWEYWAKCNRYANLITIIFKYCFINKKKSIFSLIS